MGWHEVIQDLEKKLEGYLKGTYRPLDGVPFFRVQYPPNEEREALRQFYLLTERLRNRKWSAECISLTDIMRKALESLLNCEAKELKEKLIELERERDRSELQSQLSEHLPDELAKVIKGRLKGIVSESVIVLLRLSALYPFVRSSSLESRLEGQTRCAIVLPYPGKTLGTLLDMSPTDPHGMYYRGETIAWK